MGFRQGQREKCRWSGHWFFAEQPEHGNGSGGFVSVDAGAEVDAWCVVRGA